MSHTVVSLCRRSYLAEASEKIDAHIALSEREGWHFAAKLVRGAYMELERSRAETLGVADPIHRSLEDTHACYDAAISTVSLLFSLILCLLMSLANNHVSTGAAEFRGLIEVCASAGAGAEGGA